MQQQGNIPFAAGAQQQGIGAQAAQQGGAIAYGQQQPAGGGIVSGAAGGIPNPYEAAVLRLKSIWGMQTPQAFALCNALIADNCAITGLAPGGEQLMGPTGFMSFHQVRGTEGLSARQRVTVTSWARRFTAPPSATTTSTYCAGLARRLPRVRVGVHAGGRRAPARRR
jgi:hypothetical protein